MEAPDLLRWGGPHWGIGAWDAWADAPQDVGGCELEVRLGVDVERSVGQARGGRGSVARVILPRWERWRVEPALGKPDEVRFGARSCAERALAAAVEAPGELAAGGEPAERQMASARLRVARKP